MLDGDDVLPSPIPVPIFIETNNELDNEPILLRPGLSSSSRKRKRRFSIEKSEQPASPFKKKAVDSPQLPLSPFIKLADSVIALSPLADVKENFENSPIKKQQSKSSKVMTKFKCITKTPTKTSRVLRESMPKVKQSSKTPSKVKPPSRILSPTRSLQILEKGKKLQIHSQKKHDHDLPSLDKSFEKLDEPTTPNANESYEDLTNTTSASPKLNRSLSLQEFTIKPSSNDSRKNKINRVLALSLRTSKSLQNECRAFRKQHTHNDLNLPKLSSKKLHLFNCDLTDLMNLQRKEKGFEEYSIPFFIHHCISCIKSNYLLEEGLFRISPSLTLLLSIQSQIEKSDDFGKTYLLSLSNQQDAESDNKQKSEIYTGLIKKFLRELPNPVLNEDQYDAWLQVADNLQNDVFDLSLKKTFDLLNNLSGDNFELIKEIILFCHEISLHSTENKMTAANLSRVIGPNILWNKSLVDPTSCSVHISSINNLTEFIIINCKALFERNQN